MQDLSQFVVPEIVAIEQGNGGLPKVRVTTPSSTAEVYLHGAQVTAFEKKGEPPLLFLSDRSHFAPGKAIRGGIPICYPWFGPRPGDVSHGFARITEWALIEATPTGEGVRLRLQLPSRPGPWAFLAAELTITIADYLELELKTTNTARERQAEFETCFHTYFKVGNIGEIDIAGLQRVGLLDHVRNERLIEDAAPTLRIASQTDRTYLNTAGPVEILDPVLRRQIQISKWGSKSTIVWNPWTTQLLSDLVSGEHLRFVCVESGNVGSDRVVLDAGASALLRVRLAIRGC